MLIGRANEIGTIDALLGRAERGNAGVLVIRGEPGIGKTALLTDITARATETFTVLRAQGHEVESHISFGGLTALLEPVLHLLPELPTTQRDALTGALRLTPATAGDRLGVSTAILGLIAAAAEQAPVLVSIDDAHWLDLPSLEAVVFASRRLHAERAAVVLAARTDVDTDPDVAKWLDSLPNLPIGGLTDAAALELLGRQPHPVDPAALQRHLSDTMGNPLALLELTATQSGGSPVTPVPIGRRLRQAFGQRLQHCSPPTREALLLLAVCGGDGDALRSLLTARNLTLGALEEAEAAGLVSARSGTVDFRHPLVRSAVYQLAGPAQRREAHRTMASIMSTLGTPRAAEREVWHLAEATTLPDEAVADRLHEVAASAAERRGYATATELYELAARLSPPGDGRARRMLTAAELSQQAGRMDAGLAILDRLGTETTDEDLLTQAVHLRCRIEMWAGNPVVARDRLLEEGRRLASNRPIWGAIMLSHAAVATVTLGDMQMAESASATAVDLVADLPDTMSMPVLLVRALALTARGESRAARPLLDRCRPHLQTYDPLSSDQVLLIAGLAFDALEEPAEAYRWYRRAVDAARGAGAVGLLPFQLSWLAHAEWRRGAWAAALAAADEATRLAEETGWRTEMPNSLVAQAFIEAVLGRETDCRAHVAHAVQIAGATGTRIIDVRGDIALALLDLGAARPAEAANRLERVAAFAAASGLGDSVLLGWAAEAVEAGVRADRRKLAESAYAVLVDEAARSGRPTACAREARSRALLAEDPQAAEDAIDEALAHHAKANWPFEEARTLLVQGELLRRHRRRARARSALERSADLFEQLGATAFTARALDELRAVGGPTRPRSPAASTQLTPQETNVALIVAGGATNAETAARLFLSQKTVESHLSSVYRKLGIRGRGQLSRAVGHWARDPTAAPGSGR
jgi:DNA-binding CsgD family transcriptional regulator/tetratricopeptide (TPR) repeat protein